MITLEPVNDRTFKKIVDMKLSPENNRFVAPNVVSLAQAWLYYDAARPFAVMNDGEVVGFLMMDWDEDERTAGIWRFMIAEEQQGKGYGRKAMEAAIALAKASDKIDMMNLDFVPGNTVARTLYYSMGFRENGDVEDGEIVMTLPLTDSPKLGMLTADEEDLDDFIELIESEKEAGTPIPEDFDTDSLEKALAERRIKRFTIMGESVGLALDGKLLIQKEYLEEAKTRM